MVSERALAQLRQALQGMGGEDIEAIASKGLLGQILTEHRRLGGDDPRTSTRAQLLEDGVPLLCANKPAGLRRQPGTFVEFLKEANRVRKQSSGGARLSKTDYDKFVEATAEEWRTASSAMQESVLHDVRATSAARADGAVDVAPPAVVRDRGVYRSVVSECGTARVPFADEWFERVVRKEMDIPQDEPMPGFDRYSHFFRDKYRPKSYVVDDQVIPNDLKIDYRLPCFLAHPRTCATRDAALMQAIHACTKELRRELARAKPCEPFLLWSSRDGRTVGLVRPLLLSHFRGSNPRLALVAHATFGSDGMFKVVCRTTEGIFFDMDISVVGDLFREAASSDSRVHMLRLVLDRTVFFPSPLTFRIDAAKYREIKMHPLTIYPPPARAANRQPMSKEKRFIEKGERQLPTDKPARTERRAGVRIRLPEGPHGPPVHVSDGSDESSRPSSEDTVDDDDDGTDDEADDDGHGEGDRERRRLRVGPRAQKHDRDVFEDERNFSELWTAGVLTGLSLRCARCGFSKNVSYVGRFSRAEARRRLLAWELLCPGAGYRHKRLGGKLLRDLA